MYIFRFLSYYRLNLLFFQSKVIFSVELKIEIFIKKKAIFNN